MYKLEINQEQINQAIKNRLSNNFNDDEINNPENKKWVDYTKNLIEDFVKNVKVFYDDDLMGIYEKHYSSIDSHHWYRILIIKGKDRIMSVIGLPNNSIRYEKFSLDSVFQALSFEISNPDDYMENTDKEYREAKRRYKKLDTKIYETFGEEFYIDVLGGSV